MFQTLGAQVACALQSIHHQDLVKALEPFGNVEVEDLVGTMAFMERYVVRI